MEKRLNGTEAPLNTRGPLSYDYENNVGHPEVQYGEASKADIDRRPYSLNPLNEGTGRPLREMFGEQAPLDMAPKHGWQSESAAPSARDLRQSE